MFKVRLDRDDVLKLTHAQLRNAMKEALVQTGERWHKKYLPLHFKNSATKRYGYALRSGERGSGRGFRGSYTAWKVRKFGHSRPLVKTGAAMREALSKPKIKAKFARVNGTIDVVLPRVFNFRVRKSPINMRQEITAVTKEEVDDLRKYLVRRVRIELRQAGAKKGRVTVGRLKA